MNVPRKDPSWKTWEGVLYSLDKVSYMAVAVEPVFKPEVKPEPEPEPERENSPVLPRNTGINRGKLMRQLEETEYGVALRDETIRRELKEIIKYDCSNEAIEDFCQPSMAEQRFKWMETFGMGMGDVVQLPPVCIPKNEEFVKCYPSQFLDADVSCQEKIEKSSFALYKDEKSSFRKTQEETNNVIKPINSLFRNRVDLKCRNALILSLKK